MASIVIIAPFEELAQTANKACETLGKEIPIITCSVDEAVTRAKEAERNGAEVIISRGTAAWKISEANLSIPVVSIPISGYDLLRAYVQATALGGRIGIADTEEVLRGVESLEAIFNCKIKKYTIYSLEDVESAVEALLQEGIDVLIGKSVYVNRVKSVKGRPISTVILSSGIESIIQAICEAEQLISVRRKEVAQTEQLQTVLDFITEGVIAIDQQGAVTVFNPAAERLLNLSAQSVKGRPIDKVLPSFKMTEVLQSGEERLNQIIDMHPLKLIGHLVPIHFNMNVIGVLCTFNELSQFQKQEQEIRQKLYHKGHVTRYQLRDVVGQSPVFQQTLNKVKKYAGVDSTVLVTGETGVGKEVLAHLIHSLSPRSRGPFVAVNCAAIPEQLLESELFGYVEGAFTGARKKGKAGYFELAHRGTIFLDEIGELDETLQVRLLRVLQERQVMRLGDERVVPVDVRVIAASNRNLEDMVAEGRFRADLFYRINVLRIDVPPLRERKEDFPLLCEHLIKELRPYVRRQIKGIEKKAMDLMKQYEWPGNIRELRNFIERAMILSQHDWIDLETVLEAGGAPFQTLYKKETEKNVPPVDENTVHKPSGQKQLSPGRLRDHEYDQIFRVLKETHYNQTKAAQILGISRTTLWRKLKEAKRNKL
ncbi:transcriptional regulator with PAS, ATPase and Fis domain [Caldalkalibacillus uzonensis]|uniref:Transcriptional regulator with PAS, ATPase and Fis domain n=1 Tax=Caldalkalibacillus uzonensis TaxID=353224 RepID=A0ABU0CP48_9BACI|nr:sigma 54-interacting transcriptional regulator [Caldalkalibacillus uzonensis]MDQ0338186.1 transcriptional regulator with PAS, ATPase and Fis domain [Caldalkalibacillus uzonensis]